jgi:hypothetical protein
MVIREAGSYPFKKLGFSMKGMWTFIESGVSGITSNASAVIRSENPYSFFCQAPDHSQTGFKQSKYYRVVLSDIQIILSFAKKQISNNSLFYAKKVFRIPQKLLIYPFFV